MSVTGTSSKRAEANRRNAQKSTGPRTPEGKERSRLNALRHGLRAQLPVLPGEDAGAYRARLDAWMEAFRPEDAVAAYLVERAVHVSWQIDRVDRLEAAHYASASKEPDPEEVAEWGADLFHVSGGTIWLYPEAPGPDEKRRVVSWPLAADHPGHPSRILARLEAHPIGVRWLLDRWAELRRILDEGGSWQAPDRLRAIRMLGRQPLDAADDSRVFAIYTAGHAMDPAGPGAFAEPLLELCGEEADAYQARLDGRAASRPAPRGPEEGRAALRAIVDAAVVRLEALRPDEGAAAAIRWTRLGHAANESIERLRRHQASFSRTLLRTLEMLRRHRREFGDSLFADPTIEPIAVAVAPRDDRPGTEAPPAVDAITPAPPPPARRDATNEANDPAGPDRRKAPTFLILSLVALLALAGLAASSERPAQPGVHPSEPHPPAAAPAPPTGLPQASTQTSSPRTSQRNRCTEFPRIVVHRPSESRNRHR